MGKHRLGVVAAALAGLLMISGCGLTGKHENVAQTSPDLVAESPDPTVEPATEEPSPEPPPTTKPAPAKSTRTKPATKKPKPAKTVDPNNFQAPACATYEGKAISKAKAKSALNAAAAKHYWPKTAPSLVVSSDLVRSISWNESGWQSNIVNCDGGHGLMQVMPGTIDLINTRFEQSYDPQDYRQNAVIGANYLAWLTVYIGDKYFAKNYSLSTSKCKTTSSWCLLNAVIAAYHAGVGAVESAALSKKLPSADYVYVVRSLMKSCYCDRY